MPRRRYLPRHLNNAANNSNNNSRPINGRLYIEYWIDDIEDVQEEPIHVARLNIQYHPPLTRDEAIGYVTTEYNSEVRPRLPHQDEIEYTVDFSGTDVIFDPSGHNEENTGYIAQIVVIIHPSNPEQLMTLLMQNNINNNAPQNNWLINGENIVFPQNGNTPTATPPNSPRSVGSLPSIGSTKTINNMGFNGGKRRCTKRRNIRRKKKGCQSLQNNKSRRRGPAKK
jgi:hypothetical protein